LDGFRYRLHTPQMDELGDFITIVPNWTVGETFTTGNGHRLRILRMVPLPGDNDSLYTAMWEVEPATEQ
jgi:hypothetical protein